MGHSAPLTGGNARLGTDIRDGAMAYIAMLNASGGVQGRQIELVSMDDKNDFKTAGANAKALLDSKDLLAQTRNRCWRPCPSWVPTIWAAYALIRWFICCRVRW